MLPAPVETSSEQNDEAEQIEQLLEANAALESQLFAALNAVNTPLLRVGEGVRRTTLNARSIGAMSLLAELRPNELTPTPTGRYAVQADQHLLTDWLDERVALSALTRYEQMWEAALQPPPSQSK